MDNKELCRLAINMRKFSYAPYSHYTVGAALLCENGKVYTGCNIENSAFSPTVCAERTAVFKAVSERERNFKKIAVAAGAENEAELNETVSPCGVCRQVLSEFCNGDFEIIICLNGDKYKCYKLKDLLPLAFSKDNIK